MQENPPIFTPDEWQRLVEHLSLAPRQQQTLLGLLEGKSDKQIAAKLGIAESTVRSYLQRLYARHSVQDRTGLVVFVFAEFRQLCQREGVDGTRASD